MISIYYGTRPEYIKVYRLYEKIKETNIPVELVRVNQHTSLTEDCYRDKEIQINIYNDNRLSSIVQSTLDSKILSKDSSLVVVQGDTATAFGIALNAFHHKIPVAHVEAGLRTFDTENPFPEESYRKCISSFAKYHFCVTKSNYDNLMREGINGKLYIVGNTSLDNLVGISSKYGNEILITLHRRENQEKMNDWFVALEKAANENAHLKFVFPIHPSPNVVKYKDILKTVKVCDPMSHSDLLSLLASCKFVITDSGGIQEEASFLNKKTIVCRSRTERSEGIGEFSVLCESPELLSLLINKIDKDYIIDARCPYGDGDSVNKIVTILKEEFNNV